MTEKKELKYYTNPLVPLAQLSGCYIADLVLEPVEVEEDLSKVGPWAALRRALLKNGGGTLLLKDIPSVISLVELFNDVNFATVEGSILSPQGVPLVSIEDGIVSKFALYTIEEAAYIESGGVVRDAESVLIL